MLFFNLFNFNLGISLTVLESFVESIIKLVGLLTAIYAIGSLISRRWFRSIILGLFSKIPVISSLTDLFFSHDYVEQIASGEFPVVEYIISEGGMSALGLVTHENKGKKESDNWCLVYFPTTPVPFTGITLKIDTKRLKKIDMSVQDFSRIIVSFGLNCSKKWQ